MRSRDDGSVALEWTLAMLGVLLGIAFVVQVIIWWNAQQTVTDAAQSALVAARLEGGSDAAARSRAEDLVRQLGDNITDIDVEVDRTATHVTVTVTGSTRPLRPFPSFAVHASVQGPVEQFTPNGER